MKEQKVLARLFEAESEWEINRLGVLLFKFKNKRISVDKGYYINIHDYENCDILIRFCEIKDIEITEKAIRFILQDAGYRFKDGDIVEVER